MTSLIRAGEEPAKVADAVIHGIKCRERGGFVVLPEAPRIRPGDPVRVLHGPLEGHLGLFAGMRGAERVAVLLQSLGTTELPAADVEALSRQPRIGTTFPDRRRRRCSSRSGHASRSKESKKANR